MSEVPKMKNLPESRNSVLVTRPVGSLRAHSTMAGDPETSLLSYELPWDRSLKDQRSVSPKIK